MATGESFVGLVAALPREARAVRRGVARAGVEGLVVRRAGVGAARARAAARDLLAAGATALVSVGVAGGLDPKLEAGTVLIADTIRTEDSRLPIDAGIGRALRSALEGRLRLGRGSLFGSDRVLGDVAQKRAIGIRFDCVAVDMESAAVCAAAATAGRPAAVLRVIADAVDDTIPDSAVRAFTRGGKASAGTLLARHWRRPGELWALLRLHRRYALACAVLSRALALCAPPLSLRWAGDAPGREPAGDKRAIDCAK